ncbi:MAG: CHAT domain-containing tetratricopeptide repeat protein [Bacteroidales bacterium]
MKRIFVLFIFLFGCLSACRAIVQVDDIYGIFHKFNDLYGSGDFVGAERCMLTVLDSDSKLPESYIAAACNNLGIIKINLGLYTEALDYFNKAENLTPIKKENYKELASIYNNKSRIYTFQRSYSTAIEFLEKAIRIFQSLENHDKSILLNLSSAYLNLGIIYYEMRDYGSALENLAKSASLKLNNNLPEIELTFLNLAKAYAQTGNLNLAEEYFTRSINTMNEKFGGDYYRLAEVYFDYGLFLRSAGRNAEAFEIHGKALSICLKNYGEKHSLVALSLKHLGDDCLAQADFRAALEYYQKSLIAVVNDFDNQDIFSNPQIDSSLFDIRLLDNLKSKARALELYANEQNDKALKLKTINKSLETIELALHLINNIRNNYFTEDSRIYLSENEKETYLFAVHMASTLYTLTGDIEVKEKIYSISQKAKSAALHNEITENNLLYSAAVHDTTRAKQNRLTGSIAAYNNLIIEESRKSSPDSTRISLWKDALFDMNREKERITDKINREFPKYRELILKTEPVPLAVIQRHLHRDETVVDYLLSNQYNNGTRNLYTFLITRDDFEFYETSLDSLFLKNTEIIRNTDQLSANSNFRDYTGALSYMYENLVKPMEKLLPGKKLIIIPDEEIAWLPFDAFLVSRPGPDQTDYEGLQYLIYNYTVSYGYSSSLIFSKEFHAPEGEEVLSFTPDYSDNNRSGMAFNELNGAVIEIGSIYKWFRGKGFTGNQATETNFRQALNSPAVFHLAMHSVSDTTDSRFSYIMFDTRNDTLEDGKLYNYEISLTRIQSPMVVLSACNSGTGTMYHGEGLMSLARGFILAGASSVIRTKWEVNDEVSAKIITQFYYNLSRGKHKNEAMRLAKLWYLKTSSPAYSGPYFWAAYEVLGDHAPIMRNTGAPVIITVSMIIIAVVMIFYFRRRKIFSERLL